MQKEFSLYLDLVRFFSALLVCLYHSSNIYDPGGGVFNLGHEAVVIFFVLSGFVIAFVADTKEKTLKEYAVSRMARIYSVAIPAILLTLVLDQVGFKIDLQTYDEGYRAWDYPLIRFVSSLIFTNELWFLSIQSFSNVPYWSLNYEVWYYVTFALLTYVGGAKRWWLFGGLLLLLGPKILLLMPIWWLGVYLYRSRWLATLTKGGALVLLAGSVTAMTAFITFDISQQGWDILKALLGPELHQQLAFSRHVLADYLLAIIVASHLLAARVLATELFGGLSRFSRSIRYFSSFTFAVYLFHQPLLLCFKALLTDGIVDGKGYVIILTATLLTIWGLGHFTERKRPFYKRWALKLLDAPVWRNVPFIKVYVNRVTDKL